jgi:hypothetical protein
LSNAHVISAGSVTSLAIDSLGQRQRVDRLSARIVVPGRDRWIPVVAEHALVADVAPVASGPLAAISDPPSCGSESAAAAE